MEKDLKKEVTKFVLLAAGFLVFYFLPFGSQYVQDAIISGFTMLGSYAREHVLLCLVPAFFIAGTITVFIRKDSILKLLGPDARKIISYPIAAISGGILAVCSCTILPLFGGIYKRGAGLGPAVAFLFSGPAINVAAIFLTGSAIGWEMALVRILGASTSAIFVGLTMQSIFREKGSGGFATQESDDHVSWPEAIGFLGLQMTFLIVGGLAIDPIVKASILIISAIVVFVMAIRFKGELRNQWIGETWDFAKKILPYLFFGVFAAGIISSALPQSVVESLLGGNRFVSTLFASVFGAFMYFATLTEVPIVQSLMFLGMGKGPALALFMAGNSLSLPSMIVITKLLGKKRAFTYFGLVVLFSTLWGFIYGSLF
ncbi:permease [Mesotoga sp. HF07.pep.5.2.highcov]|uniref:Putative permease n=1 Tax=Mesotoga prima MesG1.Ag.4.2 TaxID=660470 RepID=I2F6M3_9BACT|nr:putative permease [Mesotoga prima MesG1.Ag.4.2]PIJ60458.1 permease [Mesotoga sp. H07.pep.5.3]RLL90747.1 permease [Mesotoga sp. HF07.pep.5.2.highcov]